MILSTLKCFVSNISIIRPFSNSAPTFQRPDHKLYGSVDWDRIEGGDYALVDPVDPLNILYMTERDYVVFVRVCLTQATRPIVLATPRDKRPSLDTSLTTSDSSKNSPPAINGKGPKEWKTYIRRMFLNLLWSFPKVRRTRGVQEKVENLVVVSESNLKTLLSFWAKILKVRIAGWKGKFRVVEDVQAYAETLTHVLKTQGLSALITRLKVSLFAVNSYLAGNPLKTTHALGYAVRLSHGLPVTLPLRVRRSIRTKNHKVILVWASLLYSYKAMDAPHKEPDLSAITQKWVPTPEFEHVLQSFKGFIPELRSWIFEVTGKAFEGVINTFEVLPPIVRSASSGPNANPSMLSAPWDTAAWCLEGWSLIRNYLESTMDKEFESKFIDSMAYVLERWGYDKEFISKIISEDPAARETLRFDFSEPSGRLYKDLDSYKMISVNRRSGAEEVRLPRIGRLSTVLEAAGKVRIIAIVDVWTQTLLKPVHRFLFSLLEALPTDATFDQEGGVESFAEGGYKDIYSYDLHQATDTIPFVLYEELFAIMFSSPQWAKAWINLLRNREWLTPTWEYERNGKRFSKRIVHNGSVKIRYGRGQPMGAYSSWAALAVLHHAVVQFSAWKLGLFPFFDYRVLGDDVVIAGRAVANSYRETCLALGIMIGLPKSYTSSEGFFNFAAKSYLNETNLSPFSLKEELSIRSATSRFSTALSTVKRLGLTVSDYGFYPALVRQMVSPSVCKEIWVDRSQGRAHEALGYINSLLFGSTLSTEAVPVELQGVRVERLVRSLVAPNLSLFTTKLIDLHANANRITWEELVFMHTWIMETGRACKLRLYKLQEDMQNRVFSMQMVFLPVAEGQAPRPHVQANPPHNLTIKSKVVTIPPLGRSMFKALWIDSYTDDILTVEECFTAVLEGTESLMETSTRIYDLVKTLQEIPATRSKYIDEKLAEEINDTFKWMAETPEAIDMITGPMPEESILPNEMSESHLVRYFKISDQAVSLKALLSETPEHSLSKIEEIPDDPIQPVNDQLDQEPTPGLLPGQ